MNGNNANLHHHKTSRCAAVKNPIIYKKTSQINQNNDEDFENDVEDVLAAKRGYVTKSRCKIFVPPITDKMTTAHFMGNYFSFLLYIYLIFLSFFFSWAKY